MGKHSESRPIGNLLDVMNITTQKVLELTNSKSVFGTPYSADGITVIPVSKLSVGFAGGGADINDGKKKKINSPAGAGAKVDIVPVNYIVISEGKARLITIEPAGQNSTAGITEVIKKIVNTVKSKKK